MAVYYKSIGKYPLFVPDRFISCLLYLLYLLYLLLAKYTKEMIFQIFRHPMMFVVLVQLNTYCTLLGYFTLTKNKYLYDSANKLLHE